MSIPCKKFSSEYVRVAGDVKAAGTGSDARPVVPSAAAVDNVQNKKRTALPMRIERLKGGVVGTTSSNSAHEFFTALTPAGGVPALRLRASGSVGAENDPVSRHQHQDAAINLDAAV